MEVTDEELMVAYADGDLEAFETLYQRHKRRVLGYLISKLRDRDEAEEVFQTVFTKLHVARKKYRQEIPFLPWIFTIARNALVDHVRKNQTYQDYIVTSEEAVAAAPEQRNDNLPINNVFAELSSLSDTQRKALELRFNQGLSFDEIAEQLQISAVNSRQIISRAIRKLRNVLGKEDR